MQYEGNAHLICKYLFISYVCVLTKHVAARIGIADIISYD